MILVIAVTRNNAASNFLEIIMDVLSDTLKDDYGVITLTRFMSQLGDQYDQPFNTALILVGKYPGLVIAI